MNYCKKALKIYLKDKKSGVGYPTKDAVYWLKDFADYTDNGLHLVAEHHREQLKEKLDSKEPN